MFIYLLFICLFICLYLENLDDGVKHFIRLYSDEDKVQHLFVKMQSCSFHILKHSPLVLNRFAILFHW